MLLLVLAAGEPASALPVLPGDLLVTDPDGGSIVRVDLSTGDTEVVVSGGLLQRPTGIASDRAGNLYVTDPGANAVIRIDQLTGEQSVAIALDAPLEFPGLYTTEFRHLPLLAAGGSTPSSVYLLGLVVRDDTTAIREFDGLSGSDIRLGSTTLVAPTAATTDASGRLLWTNHDPLDPVLVGLAVGSGMQIIGSFQGLPRALAVNSSGEIFVAVEDYGVDTGGLFVVDALGGPATRLFPGDYAGDLAFDLSDRLFLLDGSGIDLVDLGDGSRALLSDLGFTAGDMAVVKPIPEPGTLLLCAAGFGLLSWRRRARMRSGHP